MGPDDVITPMAEHSQPGFKGRGPQNFVVPKEAWRFRDRLRAAAGKPPRFSQHSAAQFAKLFVSDEVWTSYFKFTTERNSWDLAVSAYWWYEHRHEPGISWRDFIQSRALRGYSNWGLYTIEERMAVDQVIRYDQLALDLPAVEARIGLPALDIPRAKSGYRPLRPYCEMYDDSSRQLVAEVFHREIAYFGWTFE